MALFPGIRIKNPGFVLLMNVLCVFCIIYLFYCSEFQFLCLYYGNEIFKK